MNPTLIGLNRARLISGGFVLASVLVPLFSANLRADGTESAPLLEFSSGLPGKQVRLSWPGETGLRYAIEKSTTLASGGTGGWAQVALVEATGTEVVWLDPVTTTEKAFYRISQPQTQVFSIFPPLLSTSGGTLVIRGQRIPVGSFLVIQIPGQAPILIPLSSLGNGEWQAIVSGAFAPGSELAAVSIQDGSGTTILTLNQPLSVTATGLALDSPSSLPPGAPVGSSTDRKLGPILHVAIGATVSFSSIARASIASDIDDSDSFSPLAAKVKPKGGGLTVSNIGSSGQDGVSVNLRAASPGASDIDDFDSFSPLSKGITEKGLRRGITENSSQGNMPEMGRVYKHPDLMKREMGPGAITPAPSGLPGEVSFQLCALSLETPAGPPLELVHTYRSMGGGGTAVSPWTDCYDISIQPVPFSAGSSAAQVRIDDGGGRSDIFRRQADGTYRCDGMFREGYFVGDTFTLTFADKGTWVFNPLSHPTAPGKISRIADCNDVALVCDYNQVGKLGSVSSQFGQSLTLSYGASGEISQVSDHRGRFVSYAYYSANDTGGSAGDLKEISCPRINGLPPVVGPTTFTYTKGSSASSLNGNLLAVTDGAGRELESFTYAATINPADLDYDTCASHTRYKTGHVTLNRREIRPPNSSPASAYTVFEVDEVGRLTEIDFDALHREVAVRDYTGFCTPGVPVTSSSNRPSGKLYANDPDCFETTCAYNADSCCTRITRPDGSQELVTYDRDFRRDCPVRERGNARVMTLRTSSGEMRTVTCDYLPNFGTPECRTQGTPIRGISVKGGRNPGGNIKAQARKGGMVNGNVQVLDANRKGWDGSVKGNYRKGWDGSVKRNYRKGWDGSVKGREVRFLDMDADDDGYASSSAGTRVRKGMQDIKNLAQVTRMVSAYGQVSTWGYDANGNCTSITSPLPGRGMLYEYNSFGQRTTSTCLNGAEPSFTDTCVYDATTGFLSSVVQDSGGLNLTTAFERDDFARVTRVVDPNGSDCLYGYNALDTCIQVQSPPCPSRISMNVTIDGAGRVARCDVENRGADGSLDSLNPAYSTFYVRDDRANLVRVAMEARPVNSPASAIAPASSDLASYDVCDVTLNHAGEVVRVSTPAACRGQAEDLACDFIYNERGLLDRCVEGGTGTSGSVTTEYQYDSLRAVVRCTTVVSGLPSPTSVCSYDGFHRPSSVTDPMGNVTEYSYGNDGSVTASVYGGLNDQPGSDSNLLLSRSTSRLSYQDLAGNSNEPSCLTLPGVTDACYDLKSAFFHRETEDDTITVERFSPGSTAPSVPEVTVIDRSPAGLVQQIRCNGDILATITYDSAGRPVTCANGACSRTVTRDANGRILVCGDTDHFSVAGTPSKTFTLTRMFDAIGRCTQITDGVGNSAHFAFDSLSRCVEETEPGGLVILTAYDGASSAGAFSSQVSADFDGDGTPEVLGSSLMRCGELLSTTDAHGYTTTFTTDALGRFVRSDYPDGTFETSSFDNLGFRVQGTFADGSTRDCVHDLNGRVTSAEWSNVPTDVVAVAPKTMQYDGLGNLTLCVQGTSTVAATYDSCSDQTSETQSGLTVSRAFNHRGCTGITYPDGKRFQENRNAFGELVSVSGVTPTGIVLSPPVVSYEYLGHQVSRSVQRNGVTTTFSYRGDGDTSPAGPEDFSFGSCVRETIADASAVVLSDTLVASDANQRTITCNEGYSVGNALKTRLTVTPRDRFGNVASSVISHRDSATAPPVIESSVSYTYDIDGTRLTELRNGVAGDYTKSAQPPSLDQQVAQYSTWPGGSLSWDANGNIGTFQKGTSALTFVHDAEGRVVSVTDAAGEVVSYGYDACGRREARTGRNPQTSAKIRRMIYNGPDCIQELGTDNLADMTFVCADGIRECISTRNGTIYYPHGGASSDTGKKIQDWVKNSFDKGKLGRITLITNATAFPVERFDCDESGKPIFLTAEGSPSSATSSSIGLRWLAPDCAWEPEIGMYACPGSIYSPDLGADVSSHKTKPKAEQAKKNYVGHVTLMK